MVTLAGSINEAHSSFFETGFDDSYFNRPRKSFPYRQGEDYDEGYKAGFTEHALQRQTTYRGPAWIAGWMDGAMGNQIREATNNIDDDAAYLAGYADAQEQTTSEKDHAETVAYCRNP